MTVNDLRNSNELEYEINMDKSYKDYDNIDEWGTALVWFKNYGVEYNYCIDSGINESAIYLMTANPNFEVIETDYSTFTHYEIDWNKDNWEDLLLDAMCEALIAFNNL